MHRPPPLPRHAANPFDLIRALSERDTRRVRMKNPAHPGRIVASAIKDSGWSITHAACDEMFMCRKGQALSGRPGLCVGKAMPPLNCISVCIGVASDAIRNSE